MVETPVITEKIHVNLTHTNLDVENLLANIYRVTFYNLLFQIITNSYRE